MGGERLGGVVTRMVRREDHGPIADKHAVALEVRARRRGEHHAWSVVAGESQRALMRAGREDHAACAHVMEDVHHAVALITEHVAVVVDAGCGRRGKGDRVLRRIHHDVVLVDEQDASRRPGCGRAPGGTRSYDDRLNMPVCVTCRARGDRIRGQYADTRSATHAQTVNYVDHRGGPDRLEPRRRDLDERVRLLDTGRVHAARPAGDRRHESADGAGREQCARHSVAREAADVSSIEGERDRLRAVEPGSGSVDPVAAHTGGSSPIA